MRKAVDSMMKWPALGLVIVGLMAGLSMFCGISHCNADDSVCAVVKIEIRQELTLERQAFDAHMRINNGLSHISLEDVNVSVWFNDADGNAVLASSDPDDTSASFFIRVDSMTNISDVAGAGSVAPSTSADIHWLIIPATGASNGLESGTLYYVGATLTYTIGGETNETTVSPDYIYVKPMPEITLDYFLPSEVYGDDAFTDAVEPPIPFSLGVRVKNSGQGTARELKIESAQPVITENEQGLLIGFAIEGSQVNGEEATPSLLADFGDIAPGTAGMARWIMTCTLSGQFVEFDAVFSHSDELGGELTSLIDSVETHFLVQDVWVDVVGRDRILDFLAKDGDIYRVYESDSADTQVADQSAASALTYVGTQGGEPSYRLTTTVNDSFVYVQLTDPYSGAKEIKSAVRSDGKVIKSENIWLSKSRDGQSWDYFINLFDAASTGTYTVIFADPEAVPEAPVLQYIADVIAIEGQSISFITQASDPDGTTPSMAANALPAGASYIDEGDGSGVFAWTPAIGQAGTYRITFTASDGELSDSQRVQFTIRSIGDTDGDGMDDDWEMEQFGSLDRNGSGDFDGDGISDLDEFLAGSDPTAEDHAPTVPTILVPADGEGVTTLTPELTIENSTDADGDEIVYEFEVYEDSQFTRLVASDLGVVETTDTTAWTLPGQLTENQHYYWRVRSTDGYSYSLWAYGTFFVDSANDAPEIPAISFPQDGTEVDTLTPVLEITGAADADEEELTCAFEVYADASLTVLVTDIQGLIVPQGGVVSWTVDTPLDDNTQYFWRALVTDGQGLTAQTALAAFSVNTSNNAPAAPEVYSPANGEETIASEVELAVVNAADADGDERVYYFEIDTEPGFNGPDKQISTLISEGVDTTGWPVFDLVDNTTYYWRAAATDGVAWSRWVTGSFFVNTANDAPDLPSLKNPGEDAWVDVLAPDLTIAEGEDVDQDPLNYRYEIYTEASLENLVAWAETDSTSWTVVTDLSDKTRYYWRVRSIDEDGLEGSWSATASFYVKEEDQGSPDEIRVNVATDKGLDVEGVRVYAYTSAGSYAGLYAITDGDGTAIFAIDDLETGAYQFRADYLGNQFWSETVSIPETTTIDLTIAVETVTVTVEAAAGTVSGVRVYLFSGSGSYLGIFQETDANGQVSFDLPEGETFQFRADVLGSQHWSASFLVDPDGGNAVTVDAGGGTLTVNVIQDDDTLITGIRVYLFNAAQGYLGVYGTTDEAGSVSFAVTEAGYTIRADYLGYQFWSDVITVVTDTAETIEIPHQNARVRVLGRYQDTDTPITDIKAHLFSGAGSYLSQYLLTDANGQAEFSLPEKEYLIRADYLNGQYWSDPFVWEDPQIVIPFADSRVSVTGAGLPTPGVGVYVFSDSRTYLNITDTTDENGQVAFTLPEGIYDFRVDYQGSQFWADDRQLTADTLTDIDVSVGGGTFALTVTTDDDAAIVGVRTYVFDADDVYLGFSDTTDENGQASFDLADGIYKFRVDYYGNPFWSDEVTVSGDGGQAMQIAQSTVTVEVLSAGSLLSGARVYLFSSAGTYLGIYRTTDENGQVTFDLPDATSCQFRADVLGSQYWSGVVTVADGLDPVVINAGGGTLQVTIQTDTSSPLAGLKAHLFNADGKYLGLSGETDEYGQVAFAVPEGVYQVRTDYLGYSFWSDDIAVAADTNASLQIPLATVTINAVGSYQAVDTSLAGVRVYLFTPTGSYLSLSGTTDGNGQVTFDLPQQPYTVRVDYTGEQYWSDAFTWSDPTVRIPMADAAVSVTGAGLPAAGVNVYLFTTEGTYLGSVQATDEDGMAVFRLPANSFRFRADYQGNQYWSGDIALEADVENAVLVSVGGGTVTLTLEKAADVPMSGVNCYVFSDGGTYLGLKGSTDENGQVAFDLADGTFRFRADYLGYQYWSDALVVPDSLSTTITIAHTDITLTFQADYLGTIDPLDGRRAYLFTPAGSYLGQYEETDTVGQAVFNLPDQAYTLRCDELGQHYWSELFQSTDTTVTVARGKAVIQVTFNGEIAENARVYLFSSADSYLGRYESTDSDGSAAFVLPAGQYRFRADLDGRQQWSDVVTISADLETSVEVVME